MSNIHNKEWRVEVDRDDWAKRIKPEFSEWIQKRGTGYREIKVYYWDSVATTLEHRRAELKAANDAYYHSVYDERKALLDELEKNLNDFPDELMEKVTAFNDKQDAELDAIEARSTDEFYIGFYNRDDALMFKLRWGGEAMKYNPATVAAAQRMDAGKGVEHDLVETDEERLAQLLAEFEASLVPSFEETPERHIEVQQALTMITNKGEITESECHEICCRFPSYVLACRYIIARDFG